MNEQLETLAMETLEAKRVHDEEVYLREDRRSTPKEYFKVLQTILDAEPKRPDSRLLDIGCATGELIEFLSVKQPGWAYTGTDVSDSMLAEAARRLPQARFVNSSIMDPEFFKAHSFDIITCCGVLTIFDELETPLSNIARAMAPGATAIVFTPVNLFGMDVLLRCRRVDRPNDPWHAGYNHFSKEYFERVLRDLGMQWTWRQFEMPFDIPRRPDDPLRNWTIATSTNPFQQMRGTGMLTNQFFLTFKKKN